MKTSYFFEMRTVDAVMYDGEWVWNDSFYIADFTAYDGDERKNFLEELERCGYTFDESTMEVVNDQDDLVAVEKETMRPLFAAIWRNM